LEVAVHEFPMPGHREGQVSERTTTDPLRPERSRGRLPCREGGDELEEAASLIGVPVGIAQDRDACSKELLERSDGRTEIVLRVSVDLDVRQHPALRRR